MSCCEDEATVRPVRALALVPAPGLAPERAAEVRRRIAAGAYDSLDLVEEVVRRILASGDLPSPA